MLLVAILIYYLLNRVPQWIVKEKYQQLEQNFSWTIPFTKLSGLVLGFCLAFLITLVLTKSTTDKFVENKNAVYGYRFSNIMKETGFRDSMRIQSINGHKVEKASDIIPDILLEAGETRITTEKEGIRKDIIISDTIKMKLLRSSETGYIAPIMHDPHGNNPIAVTEVTPTVSDAFDRFSLLWKQTFRVINPAPSQYQQIGGFITISKVNNFRGYLVLLTMNLLILVILNLLPFPGFAMGNFIISAMETSRRKLYNHKRKRIIGIVSIAIVVSFLVIRLIFVY